jgi:hypothetical protein
MSRELDAECGRALGWVVDQQNPKTVYAGYASDGKYSELPPFSTDPAAARQLEDEIERRGLQDAYIEVLVELCNTPDLNLDQWPKFIDIFALLRATPEQRARAFLEAVK